MSSVATASSRYRTLRRSPHLSSSSHEALVMLGPALRHIVCHELFAKGYVVERPSDSRAAARYLADNCVEFVMLGATLPDGGDVVRFTRELRHDKTAASRKSWILVLAHEDEDVDPWALKNAGVSGLIAGSLTFEALEHRLRGMLNDRREFIEAQAYVGPDRRLRTGFFTTAAERRREQRRALALLGSSEG